MAAVVAVIADTSGFLYCKVFLKRDERADNMRTLEKVVNYRKG
jgi:hypothetical protein